jgi:hypothetical protein
MMKIKLIDSVAGRVMIKDVSFGGMSRLTLRHLNV